MARIVLPAQQGHDEENGGKKVCDEGSQTGEIASERLCLNGAFIFERSRSNRELAIRAKASMEPLPKASMEPPGGVEPVLEMPVYPGVSLRYTEKAFVASLTCE